MDTPVFVIHGIGNRDEAAFSAGVADFGSAIGVSDPHPVFWGDLGARYELVGHTVPGAKSITETRDAETDVRVDGDGLTPRFLLAGSGTSSRLESRAGTSVPRVLLDAADNALVRNNAGEEIRESGSAIDPNVLRDAIIAAWPDTTWLPQSEDRELLAAVGAAVAASVPDGIAVRRRPGAEVRDSEVRGLNIFAFVCDRLRDLDRVVGATVDAAVGTINRNLRTSLLPGITKGIGDILVYQRHRDVIGKRVKDLLAQIGAEIGRGAAHPVDVIAHSLGGVIMVDLATSDEPIWIRKLITFGSQSPFFHVCDPRGGALVPYSGQPVRLPPTIGDWSNLWEPLDPVAFVAARVFQLHDGTPPTDIKVPHLASSGLWTHTDYWQLEGVTTAIRRILR